jgi:RimJ/RimL family protein N-acetyltransferase
MPLAPHAIPPPSRAGAAAKPMRLETRRYLLRTVTPADANARWLGWAADPDVMTPLNVATRQMTLTDLQRYIATFDQVARCLIGVVDKASGQQIGFYEIDFDMTHRLATFNVVIGDKAHWGERVVNETRAALLDHVFTRRSVEKAVGRPIARNFPAIFNYRAQGWRLEGILKAHRRIFDGSGRIDQFEFGLTRDDWRILRSDRADGSSR